MPRRSAVAASEDARSHLHPRLPTAEGFEVSRIDLDPSLDLTQWIAPELGNSSYVLAVRGQGAAAVIDPLRDVGGYLAFLEPSSRKSLLALDTHIHNDFVSGSRELAASAGAEVGESARADLAFPHRSLKDGERLIVGRWGLETRATPGHTPEHVSYVLFDPAGRPRALFSGGALMVGGAARTDLLGPSLARPLAKDLYRSIHERLLELPPDVRLLPTHGGGSFCATGPGDKRVSTLREERATNPLVRARTMEDFLAMILEQGPYPRYFHRMRSLNSSGARLVGAEFPAPPALSLERFDRLRAEGAVVVDTRDMEAHDTGHIPGAFAVGADGPLSAWVGWLLPPERAMVLLSKDELEARDATRQLLRIGFDHVQGFLAGGMATWKGGGRAVVSTTTIDGPELVRLLRSEEPTVVLDVREAHEWFEGHVPGSLNIPVASLSQRVAELPRDIPLVVHCAHGYRASLATSLLEQSGFGKVLHMIGGYEDWKDAAGRVH